MMCCNRCGDILSSGKCRKCGGRPVASIIASSGLNSPTIGKDASVKIADKWQSQYANGILGSQHTVFDTKEHREPITVQSTTSTPLRSSTNNKRNSIPESLLNGSPYKQQNPLSLSLQNNCTNCNKKLQYDIPSYIETGSHYCKECHVSLFSKGPCSKCKNPVFHHRDIFIEHDTQVWHKDCFRCHNCFISLSNAPMVDLKARPCCERCLMAQSGEARQSRQSRLAKLSYPATMSSSTNGGGDGDSTAASTPVLSSPLRDTVSSAGSAAFCLPRTPPPSRPRIDSVLFNHYQKSIQNEPQPTRNDTPPLPPLTPSTLSPAGSIRSSASASPVSVNSVSPSPSPLSYSTSGTYTKMDSSTTPPPPSTSRPRRLSQQLQHIVNKTPVTSLTSTPPSSSPTKKLTKKSSSTSIKKTCTGCNEIIIGTKMKLATAEGDMWYHHNCLICAGCQGSFTDSRCVRDGDNKIYHPKCQPLPSNVPQDEQLPRYQCHGCKQSIKEKCYTIGSRAYHPQCFRCFQCHDMLPPEFYEAYNEPHCEACINNSSANDTSPSRRSSMQTSSPRNPLRNNPKPFNSTSTPLLTSQRSLDHPSSVLMHRTRALPKLGGAKMCPRCHTSIAIMDEVKGPKATRWHRKCLRCAGCSKQMDMGARMSQDVDGVWLVHCRECMNNAGSKTRFVR